MLKWKEKERGECKKKIQRKFNALYLHLIFHCPFLQLFLTISTNMKISLPLFVVKIVEGKEIKKKIINYRVRIDVRVKVIDIIVHCHAVVRFEFPWRSFPFRDKRETYDE